MSPEGVKTWSKSAAVFHGFSDELVKIAGVRDALRVALTGRVPVYHGTSVGKAKKILQEGIAPDIGGGISEHLITASSVNKGLGFSALSPGVAQTYATQQRGLERGEELINFLRNKTFPGSSFLGELTGELPAMKVHLARRLGVFPGGKQVVEARIPRKMLAQQEFLNPEALSVESDIPKSLTHIMDSSSVSSPLRTLNAAYETAAPTIRSVDKTLRGLGFMSDVVQRGGIHPQNIVGSPSYRGTTLQDLKNHFQDVLQDPKGVGKDVLRSLLEIRHRPSTLFEG